MRMWGVKNEKLKLDTDETIREREKHVGIGEIIYNNSGDVYLTFLQTHPFLCLVDEANYDSVFCFQIYLIKWIQ